MANRLSVRLVGPGDVGGTAYGSELGWFLSRPSLTDATIASAYLTEPAASRLLVMLMARDSLRSTRTRVKVRLLIGSLQGFTRRAAIQACLSYTKRLKSVRLEVLRPEFDGFHLKAAHFRLGRRQVAIVGSHNTTSLGLASAGELGILTEGRPAGMVNATLHYWIDRSRSWSLSIRRYRESRTPVPTEGRSAVGRVGTKTNIADTGQTALAKEAGTLTAGERRLVDSVTRRLPKHVREIAECWLWRDVPAERLITEYGYVPGAYFDSYFDYEDTKDWFEGQARAIFEVLHVVPIDSRHAIVVHKRTPLLRYRVTPAVLKRAKGLDIVDFPQPDAFRQYADFLRGAASERR